MKRRSPLKRSPMRRRRDKDGKVVKSKYRRRERDTEYMLRVKMLPCAAGAYGTPCGGVVEADHAGRRGLGQKCLDTETIPLCTNHHRERTDFSGAFRNYDQQMMRDWLALTIGRTQAILGLER